MAEVLAIAVLAFVGLVYIWPMMEAYNRKHPHADSIAVVNLLLGWTVIAWAICLAWALTEPDPQSA